MFWVGEDGTDVKVEGGGRTRIGFERDVGAGWEGGGAEDEVPAGCGSVDRPARMSVAVEDCVYNLVVY